VGVVVVVEAREPVGGERRDDSEGAWDDGAGEEHERDRKDNGGRCQGLFLSTTRGEVIFFSKRSAHVSIWPCQKEASNFFLK